MKRLTLVFALFIVHAQLMGQAVPNVGFESWQSTPYDEPNGWISSNSESLRQVNAINSTKVTGQSGNAIRLETMVANGDTAGAFVINTDGGDPLDGQGGVPYSQSPTNITGYYTYAPGATGDSAIILVLFKKAGNLISGDFYKLAPAATFTSFSLPINFFLPITPDSVIIGAASSNLIDEVGISDGSVLVLDELAFTGTGITQSIPNGNFETWTTKSYDLLNDWVVGGEGVSRTNDKRSGTYAVRLETFESEDGHANSAQISTGSFDQSGSTGGRPYTLQADTLVGWYKFAGTADSAQVDVQLKKSGTFISGNSLKLAPAANYTAFSFPFTASQAPDSIIITIYSSKWPTSQTAAGSVLIVDDVYLKSDPPPVGIKKSKDRSFKVTVFPNPAGNQLTLLLPEKKTGVLTIYDMTGKQLMSQTVNSRILKLDVQSLNSGMYFYELNTDGGETARERFIKE